MTQTKLLEETNLFVCKHVEIDGLSISQMSKDQGIFQGIRIKTEDYTILLEGVMMLKKGTMKKMGNNCPKCGTELEEDPEDSSEGYCPKCNYGWRFPR